MNKMNRKEFLKLSAMGLATTAMPRGVWSMAYQNTQEVDKDFLKKLVEGNDAEVQRHLEAAGRASRMGGYRSFSGTFSDLTAAFFHPDSKYYKSPDILDNMDSAISHLLEEQYPNGTLDSGGNRMSPPDTAFLLESLCPAADLHLQNPLKETEKIREKMNEFLLKAGEALRTGGIHTPNHRWVVSSNLAYLYHLYKDDKYLKRMEEWLAEGIYSNEDGQHPERSRNYSVVENRAMIKIGRLLNRPALYESVRKNLESNYYYMETNGDLVTLDSRRQDQNNPLSITRYYLQYRYLANYYKDKMLAAVAKKIETFDDFDRVLGNALIAFMTDPLIAKKVIPGSPLPTDYEKFFRQSNLVRIRRGDTTASIFGGNDFPLIIASGRSVNPTFFSFRKRDAILKYARLSTSFFRMGYFRSAGVVKDGNHYRLHESKEAYYYHPLPADKRDPNGDYKHTASLDGRFWSKLDFPSRSKDTLTQDSNIEIVENNGQFELNIEINGPKDVGVVMDFCFDAKGKIDGVQPSDEKDDYYFKDEYIKFTQGNDTIEIGPGKAEFLNNRGMDGEMYSTHFGSIKGEGIHVYLTGLVPFKQTITIK